MDLEKAVAWRLRPRSRRRLTRYLVGFIVCLILFQWYLFSYVSLSRRGRIQHDFIKDTAAHSGTAQSERLMAVKKEFLHAWKGYKEHAWMADSLMPLSGGKKNQFCGWSATLVDALDTLWIMGLKDEFEEALTSTLTINFTQSACEVNTFETTIRYLGGLLAAYDLSNDNRLLPKITEIGELIHSAFNSTNGMPCSHCNFQNAPRPLVPDSSAILADVGTFYLELARLSQVTGERKYMDTVKLLTKTFERTQDSSSIPGLWPEYVNAGSITGPQPSFALGNGPFSLGAMSDSAYEYLVKTHLLLGAKTKQYAKMWKKAGPPIRQYLLFRASLPELHGENIMFSGLATKVKTENEVLLEPRTQHLACFAGGMFAIASRIFDEPGDLAIGEGLTNGCVWAYDSTPTGIMPETFSLLQCPDQHTQCAWNATRYSEVSGVPERCVTGECDDFYRQYPLGYVFSLDAHYALRPEAIESVFIMYRITGDSKWRDIGWRMFESIIKHTRTQYGHAALSTTLQLTNRSVWEDNQLVHRMLGRQNDDMESFWLAETLKYFWLLFSEPGLVSLDEWVLNTEAHPLRLNKKLRGFP